MELKERETSGQTSYLVVFVASVHSKFDAVFRVEFHNKQMTVKLSGKVTMTREIYPNIYIMKNIIP